MLNLGLKAEQRVLMCMTDSVWFPAVFWGAIKIGAVPVPVNTMLTGTDYAYMLHDSCAHVLVVSESLYPIFAPHIDGQPSLGEVVIDGSSIDGRHSLSVLMESSESELPTAPTKRENSAFWLYTSGSTGQPKGAVHRQSDLVQTARLYGDGILKLDASDVVFSAAKLFFAYGLGNSMSFPLHVGCRTVLLADRPTPEIVLSVMKDQKVSIFLVCRHFTARYSAMMPTIAARCRTDFDCACQPVKLCLRRSEENGREDLACLFLMGAVGR